MRSICKTHLRLPFPLLLSACAVIGCAHAPSTSPGEWAGTGAAPALLHDQRIAAAARRCADEVLERSAPALGRKEVEFFLDQSGVHDVLIISSVLVWAGPGVEGFPDPRTLRDLHRKGFTHHGIGSVARGGRTAACLIATRREVEIGGLPRSVSGGQTVSMHGRMLGPARPTEVLLLPPSGHLRKGVVRVEGEGFDAFVRVPGERGAMVLELIVEDSSGPRPALLARLYSGIDPPSSPPSSQAADRPLPSSTREAEKEFLAQVNGERKAHHLRPLEGMEALSRAARDHSDRMRELGLVAHILPGEGDPAARVGAAGVAFLTLSENVALGPSVESAEESLLESPAHRMNILDPRATHVGIGAAFGDGPGGKEVYVTQDFIEAARRMDPAEAAARILSLVNQERKRRGWDAVSADGSLSGAARDHSLSMMRGRTLSPSGILDRVKQRGIQYAMIQAEVYETQSFDAVRGAGAKAPGARFLGIGAVQDTRGTYWITLILVTPQTLR